jgi:hypothetical protein
LFLPGGFCPAEPPNSRETPIAAIAAGPLFLSLCEKTDFRKPQGGNGLRLSTQSPVRTSVTPEQSDPDLAEVAQSWDSLPAEIRAQLLELIRQANAK